METNSDTLIDDFMQAYFQSENQFLNYGIKANNKAIKE